MKIAICGKMCSGKSHLAGLILKKNPDYVKLAESYGIKTIYCDNRLELKKKIREFIKYDKAILCEFKVDSDQCYPLIPPEAGLDEMLKE